VVNTDKIIPGVLCSLLGSATYDAASKSCSIIFTSITFSHISPSFRKPLNQRPLQWLTVKLGFE
jgi:hypothetical protein